MLKRENLILKTPTGSGKSLVAEAQVYFALARAETAVLTYPIKALANEKFKRLCSIFGPELIGLATGDVSINSRAPVLVCTAEILAHIALSRSHEEYPREVVIDEFHYYGDRDRGVWWQIPLLLLNSTRMTLMSATMGDDAPFVKALKNLNGMETTVVSGFKRPVPLEFEYKSDTALHETIKEAVAHQRSPIYLVSFSQSQAFDEAQNAMSIDLISKDQKQRIAERLKREKFRTPQGLLLSRFLRHGIGVHHAGLLPHYRALVEELTQTGLLALVSGTDTLGVGVNVPIRTVLLTGLAKYDGERVSLMRSRDFHQISGRAGRRGFDEVGYVIVQDPPHEIENRKLKRRAQADPKKAKKLVLQKPPERGYVHWNQSTFEKLVESSPESLRSQFRFEFSIVLLALRSGSKSARDRLRRLLKDNHEPKGSIRRKELRVRLFQILRHLRDEGLIRLSPLELMPELQREFAINESLSAWLLSAIEDIGQLGPTKQSDQSSLQSKDGSWSDSDFRILSLCEAIAESPEVILNKQRSMARNLLFHQLRSEGLDREEIQDRLEEVEHPKPFADWIYPHFNAWVAKHPWVDASNVRPKSIAREMIEKGFSFNDYVREYGLERFEGVLYRYLKSTVQLLRQSVPQHLCPPLTSDLTLHIESELSFIDQSLKQRWLEAETQPQFEAMDPFARSVGKASRAVEDRVSSTNSVLASDFMQRHRVTLFRFLQNWSKGELDLALEILLDWQLIPTPQIPDAIAVQCDAGASASPLSNEWISLSDCSVDDLKGLFDQFFEGWTEEPSLLLTPRARSAGEGELMDGRFYRHWLYGSDSRERIGAVWIRFEEAMPTVAHST